MRRPLGDFDRTVNRQWHAVQVGFHPGYPDLLGFGRRVLDLSPDESRNTCCTSGRALGLALQPIRRVRHFKTHAPSATSPSRIRRLQGIRPGSRQNSARDHLRRPGQLPTRPGRAENWGSRCRWRPTQTSLQRQRTLRSPQTVPAPPSTTRGGSGQSRPDSRRGDNSLDGDLVKIQVYTLCIHAIIQSPADFRAGDRGCTRGRPIARSSRWRSSCERSL
jgi:hypothetical protein